MECPVATYWWGATCLRATRPVKGATMLQRFTSSFAVGCFGFGLLELRGGLVEFEAADRIEIRHALVGLHQGLRGFGRGLGLAQLALQQRAIETDQLPPLPEGIAFAQRQHGNSCSDLGGEGDGIAGTELHADAAVLVGCAGRRRPARRRRRCWQPVRSTPKAARVRLTRHLPRRRACSSAAPVRARPGPMT